MSLPAAEHSYYPLCSRMADFVFGLGSPLPASPLYIPGEQHRPYLYTQAEQHRLYIYFSRTASRVYISTERHRPYVRIRTLGVATSASGDPWEWRPITTFS